jgi:hypothetical protein
MDRHATAIDLLESFAERTGLVGSQPQRRYLWTDAYAVCTWLSLYARHGRRQFLERATALVAQVHEVLGRHVTGPRRGQPLGGVDEQTWRRHPTRCGLRIGKPLPQRAPGEPFDERLEWERDGQYFHYLTRWMHALERYGEVSGDADAHRLAVELCKASMAFIERDAAGAATRMVWKRSVDLDRVLVPSMGQHDPLDGWVTAAELAASPMASSEECRELGAIVQQFRALDAPRAWPSADALGLGGLLGAAQRRWFDAGDGDLQSAREVRSLLDAATLGLRELLRTRPFAAPAAQRLAFRELGLAIGLAAARKLAGEPGDGGDPRRELVAAGLAALQAAAADVPDLAAFWSDAAQQRVRSWTDHLDINAVMLAASLLEEEQIHVPL